MVDRDRLLAKLDELDGYLCELREIAPRSFEEFLRPEKKRACERLLQISLECVVDICGLLVKGKRLGLPSGEADLFDKLEHAGAITASLTATLRRMKGFRDVLVHDYTRIDDSLTYDLIATRLGDFAEFKRQVLSAIG